MMRARLSVTLIFAALVIVPSLAQANANEMLGSAIQKSRQLSGDLPIKKRLELYSEINGILDRIVKQYPGSTSAIQIQSGQAIGKFDPAAIQRNYIADLTSYYDRVCEASPSVSCLGFVSLKNGQRQCRVAESPRALTEAHRNLKNAAEIFIGQEQDSSYVSLALNAYRQCLAESSFKATTYARDMFDLDLTALLLRVGDKERARAILEEMETPSFKVKGVLQLAAENGKEFDQAFYERMKRYVEEKVENQDGNAALAAFDLVDAAFRRGDFEISYDEARWPRSFREFGKYEDECNPFFVRTLLNTILRHQQNIIELPSGRRGYNKRQVPALMEAAVSPAGDALDACHNRDKGTAQHALTASIHGQLLLLSRNKATEFRDSVLSEGWSTDEKVAFAIRSLGQHRALFEAEYGMRKEAPGSSLVNFSEILSLRTAELPVFRQLVDYGSVCEASKLLFQEMQDSEGYDQAIAYFVRSPSVDMTVKHECGDEDLELLLN